MDKSTVTLIVICILLAIANYSLCQRYEVVRCASMYKAKPQCLILDRWNGQPLLRRIKKS